MPYCTNCGHDNPEGSNFCGQCGTPLSTVTAAVDRDSATDTTRTMPAATMDERDPDSLTPEDEAAVSALPKGSALLVVRRGSNAGSRYLLNTDVVTAGRHQDSDIFLDDISVSRRHAVFNRSPEGTIVKDLGQPQRHLRESGVGRGDAAGSGRRSADRQVPAGLLHRRAGNGLGRYGIDGGRTATRDQDTGRSRPSPSRGVDRRSTAAQHRAGPDDPPGRVPRHLHFQDQVPGERGTDLAGPVALVRLPALFADRHRPAALHPFRAAGSLPAAEGDPRAPGETGPGQAAATDRVAAQPVRCGGAAARDPAGRRPAESGGAAATAAAVRDPADPRATAGGQRADRLGACPSWRRC